MRRNIPFLLGGALQKRNVAPHIYESSEEASRALNRVLCERILKLSEGEAINNMYQNRHILFGLQGNAVLIHLLIQKRAVDAKQTGGLSLVVICFCEGK